MQLEAREFRTRSVVPEQQVRLDEESPKVAIPASACLDSPKIRLVQNGDIVQAIDVTCPCGQSFRLVCEYE
jgi:hypothetical protein